MTALVKLKSKRSTFKNIVPMAMGYAHRLHKGVIYKNCAPLENFLGRTATILQYHKFTDSIILAAAWLHKAISDGGAREEEIQKIFGNTVAQLASNLSRKKGTSTVIPRIKYYNSLRNKGSETIVALALASRLAEVNMVLKNKPELLPIYQSDHQVFKRVVFSKIEKKVLPLWSILDYRFREKNE